MQANSSFFVNIAAIVLLSLRSSPSSFFASASPLLEKSDRSLFLFGGGNSCTPGPDFDWSYNTDCSFNVHGQVPPSNWGDIYPDCDGVRQSPINIAGSALSINCQSAPFSSQQFSFDNGDCMFDDLKLDISPKGWTVKVENNCAVAPHVVIDGQQYDLLQFHLHSLSEHAFNGSLFDAELHLVHVDVSNPNNLVVIGINLFSDTNSIINIGLLGSIGITISTGTGEPANAELNNYLEALADKAGTRRQLAGTNFQIMPYNMLPSGKDYFNYLGSLTTPPCNEIVTWIVMKEGITITSDNLDSFRTSLTSVSSPIADEDGNNNRPLQPLNGRTIYSCTMV